MADSSGIDIKGLAGGKVKTFSGVDLDIPALASFTQEQAAEWMEQAGSDLRKYLNGGTAMERAWQAVQIQQYIVEAGHMDVVDGNAMAALNLYHPALSFNELKAKYEKDYAGDALWEKVIDAAQENTQPSAMGCFVAGTLVHTKEGLRPIEEIQVGDYVLSKPEDGAGNPEYKRVAKAFVHDNREIWYVRWTDDEPFERWERGEISLEERRALGGPWYVLTTPNHPFWVVDSDEVLFSSGYREHYDPMDPDTPCPPWPERQWVRADHLVDGMKLQLADGRKVTVSASRRVYVTNDPMVGWVDDSFHGIGVPVDFENLDEQPRRALRGEWYAPETGWFANTNEAYLADCESFGHAPESWYRGKVYNLEVEDFHTYFVDTLGAWVHNTSEGIPSVADLTKGKVQVFASSSAFCQKAKELYAQGKPGLVLTVDGKFTKARWQLAQHGFASIIYTQPGSKDPYLAAIGV
jgi:hypothetical protein